MATGHGGEQGSFGLGFSKMIDFEAFWVKKGCLWGGEGDPQGSSPGVFGVAVGTPRAPADEPQGCDEGA
jgi:hypothetical protein